MIKTRRFEANVCNVCLADVLQPHIAALKPRVWHRGQTFYAHEAQALFGTWPGPTVDILINVPPGGNLATQCADIPEALRWLEAIEARIGEDTRDVIAAKARNARTALTGETAP